VSQSIEFARRSARRVRCRFRCVIASLASVWAICSIGNAQQHPVSVEDCVSLQRITEGPLVSRNGQEVAYVSKTPDIRTNQNIYRIWLRSLRTIAAPSAGRLLLSSPEQMSQVRFVQNGSLLSVLLSRSEQSRRPGRIVTMDLVGKQVGYSLDEPDGIVAYSISEDGNTVAYLSPTAPSSHDLPSLDVQLETRGFHLPDSYFDKLMWSKGALGVGRFALWIARRDNSEANWQKTRVTPPADALPPGNLFNEFEYAYNPSLAPDGRYLAFGYRILNPSERWLKNRTVAAYRHDFAVQPLGVGLYDIKSGHYVDLPAIPFPFSVISWSNDSSAFALLSAAPVGSKWEGQDAIAHTGPRAPESFHFFAVNVHSREVSEILRPNQAQNAPSVIAWVHADSDLLIETNRAEKAIIKLTLDGNEWKEESNVSSLAHTSLTQSVTADGRHFVGLHEDSKHPQDLWCADLAQPGADVQLTDLNPEVSTYKLGDIEDIAWENKFGALVHGKLIMPPGHTGTKRYPFVIMLTWPDEDFVCDGHFTTAFPPQPLASAGFAVAIFNVYDTLGQGANQPAGPPQTKEAESMMASVESLIDFLDRKGVILRDDVGMMGFSRSSWKVDYFLTHSSYKIRAASSADGGLGNYGNLWTTDGGPASQEVARSYGGLFFGVSRSAWLAGSPAFNADKVSTPLLMEYTGAEGRLDQPIGAYEFHAALLGLRKPVDLFFYPLGAHPLATPFERVASLQRNVDWFRFWMQGYEGIAPNYDPDQYARWRKLRDSSRGVDRAEQ